MEDELTALTRRRYDRLAKLYDRRNAFMDRLVLANWRRRLWAKVEGKEILEVGVGTGLNFPFYPRDVRVTAIDFSEGMLAQAWARAAREGVAVDLWQMDCQALEFPDECFDGVVATWVFCSVPEPIQGLKEVGRVCRRDGKIFLLEHVRSESWFGWVMDLLNPLVVRLTGANINRRTVENILRAGLRFESVESYAFGIVKLIVVRPGKAWSLLSVKQCERSVEDDQSGRSRQIEKGR